MKTTTATFHTETLTTSLPQIIKKFLGTSFFDAGIGQFQKLSPSSTSRMAMYNLKRNFKKNYVVFVPIAIVLVIIVWTVGSFLGKTGTSVKGAGDQRVSLSKPIAKEELNKSYTFTVTDVSGKPTQIKYEIQNVELRDQIILRGQPYNAVKGRIFLIANLKIVNDSTIAASLGTRDYVRLIVDDGVDKLAPEIHNDPVQLQPIASKLTRIGFAIDDSAKKLVLQVGEITGKKESIELHLR